MQAKIKGRQKGRAWRITLPLVSLTSVHDGRLVCGSRHQSLGTPGDVPQNHAALVAGTWPVGVGQWPRRNTAWAIACSAPYPAPGSDGHCHFTGGCISGQCTNGAELLAGEPSRIMGSHCTIAPAGPVDLVGLSIHKASKKCSE